MDDRLRNWHPTQAEVREIVAELRPLIHEMARHEQAVVGVAGGAGAADRSEHNDRRIRCAHRPPRTTAAITTAAVGAVAVA